jgi:hypothetical protein
MRPASAHNASRFHEWWPVAVRRLLPLLSDSEAGGQRDTSVGACATEKSTSIFLGPEYHQPRTIGQHLNESQPDVIQCGNSANSCCRIAAGGCRQRGKRRSRLAARPAAPICEHVLGGKGEDASTNGSIHPHAANKFRVDVIVARSTPLGSRPSDRLFGRDTTRSFQAEACERARAECSEGSRSCGGARA